MTSAPVERYVGTPCHKLYPQFILFGDSITQGAYRTVIPNLSEHYLRRLDIINRGFSGYGAPNGLDCLPQFFPAKAPSPSNPHVRLMTIFFGANDACIPGAPQHVPLEEYKDALRQIAGYDGIRLHRTKLIFIVPAPVDEYQMSDGSRTASHTALYAAACRETASDLGVSVLDLWTIFMNRAGWKPGDSLTGSRDAPRSGVLGELLTDGIHFSDKAYRIMYDELVALVEAKLPADTPDQIPWVFPDWKDVLGIQ